MGKKGGGETHTTTHNSPPQLLNEGREGYEDASKFYKSVLHNPPKYEGPRIAGRAPAQEEALKQQRDFFGQPQQFQEAAEQQVYDTASGRYSFNDPISPERDMTIGNNSYGLGQDDYGLTGKNFGGAPAIGGGQASPYTARITGAQSRFNGDPRYDWKKMSPEEMDRQIEAGSAPILRNLERNIMPGIRDSSQLAGQGATSRRSDIAREKALSEYGEAVGQEVLAPLIMQQSALEEDFDKAMQGYLQATAEGDATRATQASIEMARISGQSHDTSNQINATRDIAGGDLALRAQEGASRERIAGAGLKSQERLGEAGLTSQERRDAASLYSNERTRYGDRALAAHEGERGRQIQAAGMSNELLQGEMYRIQALYNAGMIDQQEAQRQIDSAREEFEEPLYRQSQAAGALAGMAGMGPGSSQSIAKAEGQEDVMGDIMQVAQIGMMVAGAAAKSRLKYKVNLRELPKTEKEALVADVMNLDIKAWRYKWDPDNVERYGLILDNSPEWIKDPINTDAVSLLQMISTLVLTTQHQMKKIVELERRVGLLLGE